MRGWTNGMVNLFRLAAGTKSCEEEIQVKLFPLLLVLPVSVSLANDTDARTCLSVCAPVFNVGLKRWYHIRRRY